MRFKGKYQYISLRYKFKNDSYKEISCIQNMQFCALIILEYKSQKSGKSVIFIFY
jgi:hypothetical protein